MLETVKHLTDQGQGVIVQLSLICHFFVCEGVQEKLGVMNKGVVYTLWDYEAQNADELSFQEGDAITILRRKDDTETEWWWAKLNDKEGYVPRNLLGVKYKYHSSLSIKQMCTLISFNNP